LIIVSAGYIGVFIVEKFFVVSEKDIQMVMLTIMIITNITNYFSIVLNKKDSANNLTYLLYGFMILIIYIFFCATNIDTGILGLIKSFYEINHIPKNLWPVIIIISLIFSFILFISQKLRTKIINNSE
jgi:hypothetical protein